MSPSCAVVVTDITFTPSTGSPPDKLADAELHFTGGGPLDGLKLLGFAVWERKGGGRNVTFPARQYSVNGERRSYALLRPWATADAQDRLRDVILTAYAEYVAAGADRRRGRPTIRRTVVTDITFTPSPDSPLGKLADAELHFTGGGPLDGLKLIGFAVWERTTGGRHVTFPARQYSVNGERRSYALLRPWATTDAQDRLRDVILTAYAEYVAAAETVVS